MGVIPYLEEKNNGLSLTLRGGLSRYFFVAADTLIAGVSVIWTAWVTLF